MDLSIKYSYEWKDDVPEHDRNPETSRPFCKRLMELDRLYTREEIESISQKVGYSIFDRCGGDGCRHQWVRQTVLRH